MIKYSLNELNPSDIAIYRIVIGAIFINIFVRTNEKIGVDPLIKPAKDDVIVCSAIPNI